VLEKILSRLSNIRFMLSVVIWIAGIGIVVWGLVTLHAIFSQERDDATSEVLSRHKTVEHYAYQALSQLLQQQRAIANVNLQHTLKDPLLPSADILYIEKRQQLLPLPTVYKRTQSLANRAKQLYQELMDVEPVDLATQNLSPWYQRLNLLGNFKLVVESNDATEIRWAFRDIREQRARSPLPGDVDIPYMIALLDYLVTFSSPDKNLVQGIIRKGSLVDQEQGNYGLQRSLIAQRGLFSKQEFFFLRDKIVTFSKKYDVPYADFLRQSNVEYPLLDIDLQSIVSPSLILHNGWYVEWLDDRRLLGVAVDFDQLLKTIDQNMKDIGLLQPGDRVQYHHAAADVVAMGAIDESLSVISVSLQQRLQSLRHRYWLKTLLLFASAILVLSIAVLVTIIQYRQQRFLALKSDFIATVSHELKTPLASVRVLAETLLRKTRDYLPAKDYPSRIIKTIDGMSLLVDNILSFNRLNKGAWNLKKSPVFIEEVISSLKKEFHQYTHLPVHIEVQDIEDIEINADQELIKILFRNLVNNACKYNEQDQVNILIKGRRDPNVSVVVQDNGIGISRDKWPLVFDEFTRYVNTRDKSISGTGLGLAICKKVMQLHDGSITIVNSSDEGTAFRVTFAA
jgi:two-component system sensor histidine kinase SenX3